jgi:tRNA G18 (ribose-2'-O)-methylase SpoU
MDLNVRSEYKQLPNEKIQILQKSLSNEISILLFNVRTSGNVAMIIRHACLLGFKEVIITNIQHFHGYFLNHIP